MDLAFSVTQSCIGGVRFVSQRFTDRLVDARQLSDLLETLGLRAHVHCHGADASAYSLDGGALHAWMAGHNTLDLKSALALEFGEDDLAMRRQIVVSMLGGPVSFDFPSFTELMAAIEIREHIVADALKTALAFKTASAERPEDCWVYDEDTGFTLRPDRSLEVALRRATQPDVSGRLYDFSCYRATEYVILLALAESLPRYNPALAKQLQEQWERKAIMSGQFHDVFMREYGSQDSPLPQRYYVPGDRLWFRNPDEASADATGYEGSWVFYLGDGLFSDFWRQGRTYTMESKCLEIYHWRHGTYTDEAGELQINEELVEAHIAQTLEKPAEFARIQALMQRYREGRGVYTDAGGCIDTTREYPRWVCPGTADLILPPA